MNILKPSFLEIMIYSNKGLLEFYKKMALRSFVRQIVDFDRAGYGNVSGSAKDTGGTSRTTVGQTYRYVTAPAANAAYGIVLGTGTNAVNISDYRLQTQIEHGSGAGQLYHQACIVGTVQVSGSLAFFNISRNFNNNSGATITVHEAGLVCCDAVYYFLWARDLTGPIDVLAGKTLAAQYTYTVTV